MNRIDEIRKRWPEGKEVTPANLEDLAVDFSALLSEVERLEKIKLSLEVEVQELEELNMQVARERYDETYTLKQDNAILLKVAKAAEDICMDDGSGPSITAYEDEWKVLSKALKEWRKD